MIAVRAAMPVDTADAVDVKAARIVGVAVPVVTPPAVEAKAASTVSVAVPAVSALAVEVKAARTVSVAVPVVTPLAVDVNAARTVGVAVPVVTPSAVEANAATTISDAVVPELSTVAVLVKSSKTVAVWKNLDGVGLFRLRPFPMRTPRTSGTGSLYPTDIQIKYTSVARSEVPKHQP